jgi:hypothetical protein
VFSRKNNCRRDFLKRDSRGDDELGFGPHLWLSAAKAAENAALMVNDG